MGDGLTFLTAPLDAGDRDHRAVGAQAVRLLIDRGCRPVRGAAGVHRRTSRKSCSRARSIRTRRSRQGWLRASHRKLDKKLSTPYRPYHTPRQEAAAQERRGGRARHRDLADLDRGAGRLPHRAHHPRQGLRLWRRRAAASSPTSRTNSPAAARSCTTTRATARRTIFGGVTSLHFGARQQPYLLLPIIPPDKAKAPKRGQGRK